jgi:3-isopropylmalate/(R)-2-methylmalate dehydratase small subunit
MIFQGTIHVVGDHCDTDVMIPGRYLSLVEPAEIAKHIFEEVDPGFVKRVKPGDILVAGKNFGSGSGREHAPFGLKALGLSCIVAASFSRTFYRMAIDLGLPIMTCEAAARAAKQGQSGRIDTESGEIAIDGQVYRTNPLPRFIQEIIDEGGLTPWVKREAARRRAAGGR